jgi:hypothetical protein
MVVGAVVANETYHSSLPQHDVDSGVVGEFFDDVPPLFLRMASLPVKSTQLEQAIENKSFTF